MAPSVGRLVTAFGSATGIANFIFNKACLQGLPALSLLRSVATHTFSISPEAPEDGAGTNHNEFQRWDNGGGTFHKSACIDPTAVVEIGAIVHPKSFVGAYAHIGSGAVIGPSVSIGQATKIGYNVTLCSCTVGDLCVIHNGVCIGQDGFGFMVDEHGTMLKKPQMLNAQIGNHVEIGANTCIDRGSWRDTVIGDHSKIDNLVQIGHNVVIGKCCMLCGQVGIAGSVTSVLRLIAVSPRISKNLGIMVVSQLYQFMSGEDKLQRVGIFRIISNQIKFWWVLRLALLLRSSQTLSAISKKENKLRDIMYT
ncbi:probable UDP-3-O-acylglucosamine N-acyltransferase 2, mitochondrial isoform X1 [Ziziphus jujuba]|uniref:Probable UDP-3-O-acylglucosamine N-acyltransferase 2, mitochondrial isoform X1 n=1 Tax=Ziziphus jujuba TaxID=326968 RepID=A0A6P6G3F9_ZIZJJ|nr:probable UDP-3-O-acylglucosamine N-acyltransferase 2, mitochondrial isoform X1 [Ziziphus jujuba]